MTANGRFPWVAVSTIGALLVVSAVAWLQIPQSGKQAGTVVPSPSLGLTRVDASLSQELLAEQLAAYDPTPLFLPSPMNSNVPALPRGTRDGVAGPFAALAPQLTKTGPVRLPSATPLPQSPVDGLQLTERADAPLTLARGDAKGSPLSGRLGKMEAVDTANGRVVLAMDLPLDPDVPAVDWQPLELMGAVTRAGLAGELVVTTSSGSDEIDDYFRSYLRENVRIGTLLHRGFYAFRVGP